MENNQQNNNQKSSVRKKANILMLSGTLLFLIFGITGITIGGLMFRNSNLNKTNIQTLEKQLLSLKKLKDLQKTNEEKSKKLENQLESEKRALEGKLALKTTTEALNNELTNVKTELTNKDLTKAFNELFKATPEYTTSFNAYKASEFIKTDEYTDALKAYKVSQFENSPEYMNVLTTYKAYKISQFKKSPEYTKVFNAYKISQFKNSPEYKGALTAYKVSQFEKSPEYKTALKNDYHKVPPFVEMLENTKIKEDELEAKQTYINAFNKWKGTDESKNKKGFKSTDEYNAVLEQYKISKHENTKAYKGNLEKHKNEFIKTKTYKTLLDTFKDSKASEQLKTAFIDTKTYKDLLEGHNQNPQLATKFKETPEYTTLLNTYKVSQFKKSPEYTKVLKNWRNSEVKKKNDELEALYKKQLKAKKQKLSLVQFKNAHPDKLPTEQKALNLIFNEGLFESKTEYTEALNAFVVNKSEFIKTKAYKTLLNTFKGKKTSEKWKTAFIKTSKYKTPFNAFNVSEHEFIQTKAYKDALIKYLFSFKGKLDALTGALNTQKTDLETQIKTKLTTSELLAEIKALLTFDNDLKAKIVSAVQSKLDNKADITALEATKTALNTQKTQLEGKINDKLTKSELLEAINALTFDNKLKTKLTTALKSEFSQYTKSTELTEAKLKTLLNNVFASKALIELNEAKLTGLKNELVKVLKDTLATKQELTGKADITALSEYLKQSKFINELYNVLSKTTKDEATNADVKAVINQMVEDKLIKYTFDKLVNEFKLLTDISQQTGRELHNTEKTNSFYKLAPFLFETPAKANAKLNELLEGNISDKKDKLAIWKIGNGNWIIGTFNELKDAKGTDAKPKYSKLQKVVYFGNTWNVKGTENLYKAPAEETTPAPVVDTTPAPAGETKEKTQKVKAVDATADASATKPTGNKNQPDGSGSGGTPKTDE